MMFFFFWIILGFSIRHYIVLLECYNTTNFFRLKKAGKTTMAHSRDVQTRATHNSQVFQKNSTITTIVLFFEKDKKKIIKNTQILIIAGLSAISSFVLSLFFSLIGFISTVQCYKNRGFQPDKALNISLFSSFFPTLTFPTSIVAGQRPSQEPV